MTRTCRLGFLLVFLVLMASSAWGQSVTRGPYLQTQTDNSIIVRWRTDIDTDSFVRYGTDKSNLNLTSSEGALTTEHTVLVSGLSAATEYFYSVAVVLPRLPVMTHTILVLRPFRELQPIHGSG